MPMHGGGGVAGASTAGGFMDFLGGDAFGDVLGGLGGLFDAGEDRAIRQGVERRAEFADQRFDFGGLTGNISGGSSTAQLGTQQQQMQDMLQQLGGGLLGGQARFQDLDFLGALGQQQQFSQGMGNQGLQGGLQGMFNQTQGLGNFAGGLFAGGPGQDFTGGRQGQAFQQGFGNLQAAGNQDALRGNALATMRAEAQGSGQLDQAINRLQNRQFAQGRLGSTGGQLENQGFLDAVAQQDLGFQNAAFGIGNQQGQLLSQIGQGQLGVGANLFGQNQQALQGFGQQAQGFFGQAAGLEGQQFGQNLQANMFGQQGSSQFLQQLMGMFGQGQAQFGQNFGLGLDSFQQFQDRDRLTMDQVLGMRNAETDRIAAAGQSAQALLSGGGDSGGGFGDLIGAAAPLLLASDIRLKKNIVRLGQLGGLGWYKWDWNEEAEKIGVTDQNPYGVMAQEVAHSFPEAIGTRDGYLTVDYGKLL